MERSKSPPDAAAHFVGLAACAVLSFAAGTLAASAGDWWAARRSAAGAHAARVEACHQAHQVADLMGQVTRLRSELTDARAEADGLRRAAADRPDPRDAGERIPAQQLPTE